MFPDTGPSTRAYGSTRGFFSCRGRRRRSGSSWIVGMLLAAGFFGMVSAARAKVHWVWSGAVTSETAVVKARVDKGVRQVRLVIQARKGGAESHSPTSGFTIPDAAGIVTFSLESLQPGTQYQYWIEVEGTREMTGGFGTFSAGAFSFKVAFGSCASTGSNHRVFSRIRQANPDLFIHLGDFHYENIAKNDPERFLDAFDKVLSSPRQAELYRSVPIAYIWDDHDYGPNNSDRTSPSRPAALATYQQVVPHYPLTGEPGRAESIQQAFSIGRVLFIMTDGRSFRSPETDPDGPGKTMLGADQVVWFKTRLATAVEEDYALIAWVNSVPWITWDNKKAEDGWESYSRERTELADYFKQLGITSRMVVLSGDAHMVAMDDGSYSNYASDRKAGEKAFPVVHSAPLDRYPSTKGGPYSKGTVAGWNLLWLKKEQRFTTMEIQDDGNALTVFFQGFDGSGRPLERMQMVMHCSEHVCEAE